MGPTNHVSDADAHWHHMANAMDQSVRRRRCSQSLYRYSKKAKGSPYSIAGRVGFRS